MAMRHVISATPVALGGALVVPAGLLRKLRGEAPAEDGRTFAADAAARARIEQLAMDAVRKAEEARGCCVVDVSAQKCGWDITSYPPAVDGKQPDARHIEVKGRVKGASTVTVTRNEMLYALNQADKFVLAIVLVGENDAVDGPYYLRNPSRPSRLGRGVRELRSERSARKRRTSCNDLSRQVAEEAHRSRAAAGCHQRRRRGREERSMPRASSARCTLWWARRPLAAARAVIFCAAGQ